jgi:hypothetical protein
MNGNISKGEIFKILNSVPDLPCISPVDQPCNGKIIDSHSIQKARALRILSENGHVKMFDVKLTFDTVPKAKMVDAGINEATTFRALCGKHDKSLFVDIDDLPLENPSSKQLFLLAYRSFLKGYYEKKSSSYVFEKNYELTKLNQKLKNKILDASNLNRIAEIKDFEELKNIFDKAYISGTFTDFDFLFKKVDRLPFSVSSFFAPTFSLSGQKIYDPFNVSAPAPRIALDVFPVDGGSMFSFCVPKLFKEEAESLMAPFAGNLSDVQMVNLIWQLSLRYCENVAVNPTFWNDLSSEVQNEIETFFHLSLGFEWVPCSTNCCIF